MAGKFWWLLRATFWSYWAELLVSLLIGLTVWVSTLHNVPKGSFQSLQMLHYSMLLLIGFIAMFNSAQTRVFTQGLLADKKRGSNAKKR